MTTPALVEAGLHLADLLAEENRMLAAMQLPEAAALNPLKQLATASFTAARAASANITAAAPEAAALRRLSERLAELAATNRALLERAIAAQARLIDCIAIAARPAGPGYAAPPTRERPAAFALNARA
jgi:hypothetical protein